MNIPLLKVERKEEVVWLTLNSPDNMNALSLEMLSELEAAVDSLHADNSVRCVVLTGEGKAFSAGGDLRGFQSDLADHNTGRLIQRLQYAQDVFAKVETLPMPVVAAVHGYAIAGGLELLLCCDIIVAAQSARIGDGHARYGVIPAGGSSARLPRKIAANRANEMLLTAELYPASVLEQWGLVNHVVPDTELLARVVELAGKISSHSPLGLKVIKELALGSLRITPEEAARAEIKAFETYAVSADFAEGLAAFVEKRKPLFTGN